jgi:hypothetical protein
MKHLKSFVLGLIYGLAIVLTPMLATADGRALATKSITELATLAGSSVASGDFIAVYDVSALDMKKVDASPLATLAGVTASSAELNYNDITTLGTVQASKAVTADASKDITGARNFSITGDLSGDGGDQFYGFLQDQVASTTTSAAAAQCGKTFVSDSADVMTLPEASTVLGCRYTFVCGTADDLDINPADASDQIGTVASITGSNTTTVLAPSAGDAVRCTDIGSSITLEAVAANLWVSVGNANGIWTDVN